MTKIPNPYKAALKSARPSAAGDAHDLEEALKGAAKAMAAGAWQSTVATHFEAELKGKKRTLHNAGQSAVDEIDDKIAAEPDMVDSSSFQAHWMKMRQLS